MTIRADALSAAEAEVHAERWRCMKIRPRRLSAPSRPGLPTVRRAANNRAPSRRYAPQVNHAIVMEVYDRTG